MRTVRFRVTDLGYLLVIIPLGTRWHVAMVSRSGRFCGGPLCKSRAAAQAQRKSIIREHARTAARDRKRDRRRRRG